MTDQELADPEKVDDHDFSNRVLIFPALYQPTDEIQAEAALVEVFAKGGFGAGLASKVAATLPKVYPNTRTGDARRGWGPLQPDRLGEELVLEVLGEATSQERCNDLVCAIFPADVDEAQAEKALLVLVRAAGLAAPAGAERATTDTALARQRASGCIQALLERYPDPFLLAAITVAGRLSEPAPLIDIIRSTLRCADSEVSRRAARLIPATVPALAPLEAALWQRCVALALERSKSFTVSQELDLAYNYHWLSDAYERANDSNARWTPDSRPSNAIGTSCPGVAPMSVANLLTRGRPWQGTRKTLATRTRPSSRLPAPSTATRTLSRTTSRTSSSWYGGGRPVHARGRDGSGPVRGAATILSRSGPADRISYRAFRRTDVHLLRCRRAGVLRGPLPG